MSITPSSKGCRGGGGDSSGGSGGPSSTAHLAPPLWESWKEEGKLCPSFPSGAVFLRACNSGNPLQPSPGLPGAAPKAGQPPLNGESGVVVGKRLEDVKRLYLLVPRKERCSGPGIHFVDPRDVIFQCWLPTGQPATGEIRLLLCFHTGPRAFSKHPEIQR